MCCVTVMSAAELGIELFKFLAPGLAKKLPEEILKMIVEMAVPKSITYRFPVGCVAESYGMSKFIKEHTIQWSPELQGWDAAAFNPTGLCEYRNLILDRPDDVHGEGMAGIIAAGPPLFYPIFQHDYTPGMFSPLNYVFNPFTHGTDEGWYPGDGEWGDEDWWEAQQDGYREILLERGLMGPGSEDWVWGVVGHQARGVGSFLAELFQ